MKGAGRTGSLAAFVDREPSDRKLFARGDNVESGDFFPEGSCDLLMLSEARSVYRLLADPRPETVTRSHMV